MGFRKQRTIYRLRFEDPSLDGLEVTARSLPLKDFLAINRMTVSATDDAAKQTEQSELMLKKFAEALIGWNLEDEDGKPVPATHNGLLSQESQFVIEIIRAWMEAVAGVPKVSATGLNGGGTYPEQSIPMEVS